MTFRNILKFTTGIVKMEENIIKFFETGAYKDIALFLVCMCLFLLVLLALVLIVCERYHGE